MAVKPSPLEGPLRGVTVVDLTRVLSGPYCTMVLADLGARVIKVEQPEGGDDTRQYGPFVNGKSAYFMSLNRAKESIALDLKDAADRKVFDRLLERADVLTENFRPGTLAGLGYDWATLHRDHPRLIYAACSGFGHTGPYARRAAYDLIVQAMGGLMSITGYPGLPPVRAGAAVGDITAALYAAIGISAALYHRQVTNEGVCLDISMLDCQVALCENAVARNRATGEVPARLGTAAPSVAPFGHYATKDRTIVIGVGNDSLFSTLCATIGRSALAADPRFASNESRIANASALREEIETALRTRGRDDWLQLFHQAGIPAGPVNTIEDVVEDVQVNHRNMIVEANDATAGKVKMAGNPIKISAFKDLRTRPPSPGLDEHRAQLLSELGLAEPHPGRSGVSEGAEEPGAEQRGERQFVQPPGPREWTRGRTQQS